MPFTILAADTSTAANTVAVCRDGQIVAEIVAQSPRLHAERLIGAVDWVLQEAQLDIHAVDCLAIAIGPGSFTGLRIGASTWKGLALAAKKPLVAVPTLDALALLAAPFEGTVVAAVDARMGEVYGAVYRFRAGHRERLRADAVQPMAALLAGLDGPVYCVGDGFQVYREAAEAAACSPIFAPAHLNVPRASAVAAEAVALLAAGAPSDAGLVSPVYLRASQAEVNRDKAAEGVAP